MSETEVAPDLWDLLKHEKWISIYWQSIFQYTIVCFLPSVVCLRRGGERLKLCGNFRPVRWDPALHPPPSPSLWPAAEPGQCVSEAPLTVLRQEPALRGLPLWGLHGNTFWSFLYSQCVVYIQLEIWWKKHTHVKSCVILWYLLHNKNQQILSRC